jgi:A/G-specific adenine glycosylase
MREDGRGVPVEEECASDPSTHTRWFRKRLLAWFKLGGRSFPWREPFRIPYEVVVAEILLQRTTANGVARAYPVFLERYPSWEVLSRASLERLQEDLRPLGLWRQKAAVFRSLARSIEEGGGRVPASRQELERLRGVGQYTASAILAVVYGRAEPLVDANAARVLGRFFGPQTFSDIGRDPTLHALARRVVLGKQSLLVSWAILDFGALVCRPRRPHCQECPLRRRCGFFAIAAQR